MLNEALLFSFLLVFIRCGAMLLASPMFGAQNTPLPVRIFTTLSIAAALTCALNPAAGHVPGDMYVLLGAVFREAMTGLLLGLFMSLVLQAAQMAGSVIDLQMGLGMSQALNPLTGVPVTVLSQFKYMLSLVIFLSIDGHHLMIITFAKSYTSMPPLTYVSIPALQAGIGSFIGDLCLLAIQMAAPVLAVSLIVDAGLGIVSKAVPQVQAMLVGLPAKVILGMIALSVGLPALTGSVSNGIGLAMKAMHTSLGMR